MIAVGSLKGSPGATTLAVALAAVWPGESPVLVEVDCAGGDLGGWHWAPDSPGLASLANACRAGNASLTEHTCVLPCGVQAVVAAAGRQPATVAVDLLAQANPALWAKERAVIVDVGRLEPGSPGLGFVELAEVLLVVARGDGASLLRVAGCGLAQQRARLVLAGGSGYPLGQVSELTGLPVAAELPWDSYAAQVIGGRRPARRGWTRRGLPAAARALAVELAAGTGTGVRGDG
jgi:hypothetical protein